MIDLKYTKIFTEKRLLEIFVTEFHSFEFQNAKNKLKFSLLEEIEDKVENFQDKDFYYIETSVSGNFYQNTTYELVLLKFNEKKKIFQKTDKKFYLGTNSKKIKCERGNFPYVSCDSEWKDGEDNDILKNEFLILNHYILDEFDNASLCLDRAYRYCFFDEIVESLIEED